MSTRFPILLSGDSQRVDRGGPFLAQHAAAGQASLAGTLIVDSRGNVRMCSAALASLLGRTAADCVGRPAGSLVSGLLPEACTPGHDGAWAVSTLTQAFPRPLHLVAGDGTSVAVDVACATLQVTGETLLVAEVRSRADAPAADELRGFAWVAEQSTDSVMITDAAGTIEYVNPAFESMTGYPRIEATGNTPALLKSGAHEPEVYRGLWATICAGQTYRGVLVNRRKNGETYHEAMTIRPFLDRAGRIMHFGSAGRDVSDSMSEVERLRHAATHDGLTGLPNRELFLDRLDQALNHATRRREGIAVAIVDIDQFKAVNDRYGHAAGDCALRAAGARLRQCVRDEDTVARLGGDEFGVILAGVSADGVAASILAKIVAAHAAPLQFEGHELRLTLSIGACIYPRDGRDGETLRRCADRAMYSAKRAGGDAYRLFRPVAGRDRLIELGDA